MAKKVNKADVMVGYTKNGIGGYHTFSREALQGADVSANDGLGNIITVAVREGEIGYRITVNGKIIAEQGN